MFLISLLGNPPALDAPGGRPVRPICTSLCCSQIDVRQHVQPPTV